MRITEEHWETARDRAEHELQWRNEDEQWAVLDEWISNHASGEWPARMIDAMMATLTLECIREHLYSGLTRAQWNRMGWNRAMKGDMPASRFIHKARVAQAAGSSTGRL